MCHQVYDGSKAFWEESDKCNPINMYGITKLEAEEAIKVSLMSGLCIGAVDAYWSLQFILVAMGLCRRRHHLMQ